MASNDGRGGGGRGETRRQAIPGAPTGKGLGSTRKGDTTPGGGPAPQLPEVFGRYQIRKLLGGGGMGAVYLAYNTELEREEALKVPHFDAGTDPEIRERFLREARSAARLDHPNICPIYDVGVQDGTYYLTMRFLKGRPLSDYAGTPQPVRCTVEAVARLGAALHEAHKANIIHRDLKPGNVMMCPNTGPTVMDFGLARQVEQGDQRLTRDGTMLGTPAYMPPEQLLGKLDEVGKHSDVYSLGVILYELLTGRLPFVADTLPEMYGMILRDEPPRPSQLRPDLPAVLDDICARAMAKSPGQRYASMKEFVQALAKFLESAGDLPGGSLVARPRTAAPTMRGDILAAATVAPSRTPVKSVPPPPPPQASKAPPPPPEPPRSAARQPVPATVHVKPTPRADLAEKPRGTSPGTLAVGCLGGLLLLGGLVGVVWLVFPGEKSASDKSGNSDSSANAAFRPLFEDFKKVKLGERPEGWVGDAFGVQEKNSRVFLAVMDPKSTEIHYLKLPKMALKGDFLLEAQFCLGGGLRIPAQGDHEFQLQLSGEGFSPLPVVVAYNGYVSLDSDRPQAVMGRRIPPGIDLVFRLARRKDEFIVRLNDGQPLSKRLPDKGTFDEIRIGLTGGLRPAARGKTTLAQIYYVKLIPLEGKAAEALFPKPPEGEKAKRGRGKGKGR